MEQRVMLKEDTWEGIVDNVKRIHGLSTTLNAGDVKRLLDSTTGGSSFEMNYKSAFINPSVALEGFEGNATISSNPAPLYAPFSYGFSIEVEEVV